MQGHGDRCEGQIPSGYAILKGIAPCVSFDLNLLDRFLEQSEVETFAARLYCFAYHNPPKT
jgi:hypothetical protein